MAPLFPKTSPSLRDLTELFSAAIEAKDKHACIRFLTEYPEILTQSGSAFEWLNDSFAIELTSVEIIDLLVKSEPYIRPDLIHVHGKPALKLSDAEVKRTISELCGLGGSIPTRHNRASWTEDTIDIQSLERTAELFYGSELQEEESDSWLQEVLDQCLHALDRLVGLFRLLQLHQLVGDHFVTFYVNPDSQIENVQVPISLITRLRLCVVSIIVHSDHKHPPNFEVFDAAAGDILRLISPSYDGPFHTVQEAASRCALAVQALCVAVLSLGQTHIGEINPFFLEHSLSQVELWGTRPPAGYLNFSKMHWKAGTADDVCEEIAFELDMSTKITIGALFIKQHCLTESGPDNTILAKNISSDIKALGTSSARWVPKERQIGLQGGQFLNATLNQTWISSKSQTRKRKGVKQADLDFLDQPWGLLVSVCTGVAQRVALREVLAEFMLPMTDGWIDKPNGWEDLITTDGGLLEALKKPIFRNWAKNLRRDLQHALKIFIDYILQEIRWTGVDDNGGLIMACPQYGNSDACVCVPLKDAQAFTWLLQDTDRCATFASLTNMCFLVDARADKCQNKRYPKYGNHVRSLITSVCQYQWLGADDWVKLPETDLQNRGVHWISTSEEKRTFTVETDLMGPVRLMISNSRAHWRYFRRAWERIERIRQTTHIELRERSWMAEDYVQDVVIVREQ